MPHHPGPYFSSAARHLLLPFRWLSRASRPIWPVCAGLAVMVVLTGGALAGLIRTAQTPAQAGTQSLAASTARVAGGSRAHEPDLMIVSQRSLPASALAAVQRTQGVTAAEPVDAARIQVNGKYVSMLGVDPATFRGFAAHPTAASNRLWQNVAAGGIAVSYTMGSQDHIPVSGTVRVSGAHAAHNLPVGGRATVGIAGIDTVVSRHTAASLGLPAGNAIIVSAANTSGIAGLTGSLKKQLPSGTVVQPLVPVTTTRWVPGQPGQAGGSQASGSTLRQQQINTMLNAALSRRGMPYVWGAEGPSSFDCSGLVQWSFAQAGITMPRVAADQALTGPAVPAGQLQPGDLLFWRTDPTAPDYISHVAIYLGNGWMIQAPEPGAYVEVVPAAFGSGYAGAVRVEPQVAASVPG